MSPTIITLYNQARRIVFESEVEFIRISLHPSPHSTTLIYLLEGELVPKTSFLMFNLLIPYNC